MTATSTPRLLLAAGLLASAGLGHAAADTQRLCVYDLLGNAGDMTNIAKDYATAAQTFGLISFNDRLPRRLDSAALVQDLSSPAT